MYALCLFLQDHVAVGKRKKVKRTTPPPTNSTNKRRAQTTSTERCAHRTVHFSSSGDSRSLDTTVHFIAFRRMRLTHSAVCGKRGICRKMEPERKKRRLLEKTDTKKSMLPAEHPSDQKKKRVRFGSSEEMRPRDASPVSIVFGVDRGQVFGAVGSHNYQCYFCCCCCCCFCCVGFSCRKPKEARKQVLFCKYS